MTVLLNPYRFVAAGGYDPDASAYFAAMTVQPTETRKGHINTLVLALKAAGVWTKLDHLSLLASHDAQAARLNSKEPTGTALSAVNGPIFTTDQGYAGDALSAYLNTGFNPTTASSPKFTRNSAHIGIYSRTSTINAAWFDIGAINSGVAGTRINAASGNANTLRAELTANGVANYGTTGSASGHLVLSRTSSTSVSGYRNGAALATVASTSVAPPNAVFHALTVAGITGNFSGRQLASLHWGDQLSSTEAANFYAALNAYLTSIGANV